ncbi:MAG TPA: hypothetical protein VJ348_03315, partial [Candidatus Humimicrobiaceae bacterium]|nr:hypothetical protein [Candidatus Humimicrobiaceae bacterium]
LATGNWDVQLNPKYSGDSEAEELLNSTRLFMHGDGAKNPGARFLGWGIRGASLWKGPEDIEQDVVEFTKGRLKRDPRFDKTLLTDGITHDSPEAHVLAYLVPMLIGGIHGFRIATENRASATPGSALEEQVIKLKRAEEWLQTMGKKYLEILRDPKDRVFASFPSLHWLTFEKTRA